MSLMSIVLQWWELNYEHVQVIISALIYVKPTEKEDYPPERVLKSKNVL